jgi:hypothetical protein
MRQDPVLRERAVVPRLHERALHLTGPTCMIEAGAMSSSAFAAGIEHALAGECGFFLHCVCAQLRGMGERRAHP